MRRLPTLRGFVLLTAVTVSACTSAPPGTTVAGAPSSTTIGSTAPPTTTTLPASTTTTVPQAAVDIRAALDGYSGALAQGDGRRALTYVDSGTLELFEDLLLLAGSPVHVDELDYLDAFLVLRLRHRFSAEDLGSMTAEDVFLTAIEDDLLFSSGGDIAFEAINIVDDEATGEVGGSPAMWFTLEDGEWKVALGRTFEEYAPVLSLTLEAAALQAAGDGATRGEALLLFLSTLEGAEVDPALLAAPMGG